MAGSKGWVYLVTDGQYTKIGLTRSGVDKRNRQHQTGNPNKIRTVYTFWSEDVHADESALHQYFKAKHYRGEWFSLDMNDVFYVMDQFPQGYTGSGFMTRYEYFKVWGNAVVFLVREVFVALWRVISWPLRKR